MIWLIICIIIALIAIGAWYWTRVQNAVSFKAMGKSGKELISISINGAIVAKNVQLTKKMQSYVYSSINPIESVTLIYMNPGLGKIVQIAGGKVMVGNKNILNERLIASQTSVMQNVSNLLIRAVNGTIVRGGSYKMIVN